MKQKIKNFKFTKKVVTIVIVIVLFLGLFAGGVVYAAEVVFSNTVWTGQDQLDNGETLVGYLVADINTLTDEIADLDTEIDNLNGNITGNAIIIAGLEQDKADLEQQVLDLQDELLLANQAASEFQDAVCLAIENLPNGIRNRVEYTDICPVTP